ncbi:MAG: sulfotransferase [Geodermatophilaceae bacterium]|nr:sulfotransferase [Geodermatophilaceae bacterium]
MSLPDVYLIGAPKAGTTSLADWLAQHPDVYFSVPKEPFFWASDYPRMRERYGFADRSSYESLFASPAAVAATLRAEGSTTYLYSRVAVPDIVAAGDGRPPRFVVSLRKPVDLLISYHRTQVVALNEDEPDFATAWRRSVAGVAPTVTPLDPKLVDYPSVGALGAAMARLYDTVGRDRVHVVLFDDLARDPASVWIRLTAFLGVAANPAPAFEVRNASTKGPRSAGLRRLTHNPPAVIAAPVRGLRQWSRTTSNPLAAKLKGAMWKSEAKPDVDDEVRAEVAAYLAADTLALGELIGHDLRHWTTVPRE